MRGRKLTHACAWRRLVMLAVCTALSCVIATAATVADNITLNGGESRTITVSSGTDTYTGVISGDGSLVKAGGGTLVLAGNNTFSGGMTINAGAVQADTATALGSGTVTLNSKQLLLNAGSSGYTTIDNDIVVTGNLEDNGIQMKTNIYMRGRLTSSGKTVYLCHTAKNTGTPVNGGTSSKHGDIDVGSGTLNLNSYGTMCLTGKVTAAKVCGGTRWSSGGTVELWNPQNEIGSWHIASEHVMCMETNVMRGVLTWELRGGGYNNCNTFMLNGHDQSVAGITYTLSSNVEWNKQITNANPNQITIKSSPAATLTIRGRSTDCACWSKIQDGVSLVLDARDYAGFTQSFNFQANKTAGTIAVSNGTFAVCEGATFKNVPRIDVASGGHLTVEGTANAFPGVTTLALDGKMTLAATAVNTFTSGQIDLALGENAEVTFPTGMVLAVKSLTVNGSPRSGVFTPANLPQLKQGMICTEVTDVTSTSWTALGADDLMTTGENWSSVPDMQSGAFLPTFALNGSRASVVYADTFFNGIRFAGANGFTIDGANDQAKLFLGSGGIVAAESEGTTAYVIDVPVKRMGATTSVYAPKGQNITFRNAFNDAAGDANGAIAISGLAKNAIDDLGRVSFEGTNVIAGQIVSTSAVWRVSGLLGTPGHVYEGVPTDQSPGAILLRVASSAPTYVSGSGTHGILLDNATIEKSIWMSAQIGERYLWAASGTTNEIKGYMKFYGVAWQGIHLEAGSETTLSGGLEASHSFRMFGGGTLRIKDVPIICTQSAGFNPNAGTAIFEVPGNKFNYLVQGYAYGNSSASSRVETVVSYAITNGYVQVGGNGSDMTHAVAVTGTGTHVLDLHCTTQRCQKLGVMPRGTLTGQYPAMLEVFEGRLAADPIGYSVVGEVTGGVGLHMCGTGTLMLTNKTFASCGDLKVSNGVMEFAAGGSWPNGTNVTVCGTGTLKLGSGDTFDKKHAVIRFAETGKIEVPAGVSQKFAEGWVDDGNGYAMLAGGRLYTAENLPAHISGAGSIHIAGHGVTVIIR